MKYKIAINARCFTRRITGVERCSHEISRRLVPNPRLLSPRHSGGRVAGHLWEQILLPRLLGWDEILWSPANTGAWIIRRQVVTLHDAGVFDHPEWFQPSFAAWTRLSWRILAWRAMAIATVSQFSRKQLAGRLNIPIQKISVIPNGVGFPFRPQSNEKVNAVRGKYNLTGPYFLFVGTLEPRKNLETLVAAFEKLNPATHALAVVGEEGKVFAVSFAPLAGRSSIRFLGRVPDADLPGLYAGSTAVLIPSFYEGFGLTLLEAMACGAPVIASHIPAFLEVADQAVYFVDPKEAGEILEAMQMIIETPALGDALRDRGLQQAARYTWDDSAGRIQSLIEGL